MPPSNTHCISSIVRILKEKSYDFIGGIHEENVSLDYSDTVSPHDISKCEMGTLYQYGVSVVL